MLTAREIVDIYISFFEKRGHKRIGNASLVPVNDPTTLFISSGMQPLVPYLLGEPHPQGKRLVNVQNCFRAQDIEEVGDNRHTTFFRMLGNWSLGDYFKKEQLPWFFEFLTKELGLDPRRLYVSVFEGYQDILRDEESYNIWAELFQNAGIEGKGRIFVCGTKDNWWSRAGIPEQMPPGEPGGPDSEVYFDLQPEKGAVRGSFKNLSDSGRLLEIGNSVFMEYQKQKDGTFRKLPQQNVDFGAGLERLLAAVENKQDMFQTSLISPIVRTIELLTQKDYEGNKRPMRIITDHLVAASFMIANTVSPSNKEQGYILRRLLRRAFDNLYQLGSKNLSSILETIVEQYQPTAPNLASFYEKIKLTIQEEEKTYSRTLSSAKSFIQKKYPSASSGQVKQGDELKGVVEISADDAFLLYTTHGLSPAQIKNLGYSFNEQEFAEKMKQHQKLSRKGAEKKFHGGLADHQKKTIMGHTATHLLHQAIRDVLGNHVYQTGSNITTDRIRFDFNFDRKLTDEQLKEIENIVNQKIRDNLKVHFEMMELEQAKKTGAIGLFDQKYQDKVKVYFIGDYSKEFCGGPHVDFTGELKSFKIIKQENIGHEQRRIYSIVNE